MGPPPANRGAGTGRPRQPRSPDAAVLGRGILLAALSTTKERMDLRIGNTSVRREVVAGASYDGTQSFQRGRCFSRRGARFHRGELSAGNAGSKPRDRFD